MRVTGTPRRGVHAPRSKGSKKRCRQFLTHRHPHGWRLTVAGPSRALTGFLVDDAVATLAVPIARSAAGGALNGYRPNVGRDRDPRVAAVEDNLLAQFEVLA